MNFYSSRRCRLDGKLEVNEIKLNNEFRSGDPLGIRECTFVKEKVYG